MELMPYEGTHNNTVWENGLASSHPSNSASVAPFYSHSEFNEKAIAGSQFDQNELSAWADPKVIKHNPKLINGVKKGIVGVSLAAAAILALSTLYEEMIPVLPSDPVLSYISSSNAVSYSFSLQCPISVELDVYVSLSDLSKTNTKDYLLSPESSSAQKTIEGVLFSIEGSFYDVVADKKYVFSISSDYGYGETTLYSSSVIPNAL